MTLIECLKQLPDDMVIIDLTEVNRTKKLKTIAQLRQQIKRDEDGYEIRDIKTNYGKTIKKTIGIIGGSNVFNEN